MKDEELKQLIASLGTDNLEIKQILKSTAQRQKNTDRGLERTEQLLDKMTQRQENFDVDLKETMTVLDRAGRRLDRMAIDAAQSREEEAKRREEEAKRREEETIESVQRRKEIDKQLKELGKQIGGLGNKFGFFTEGLALPSMTKVLTEHFKMEVVAPRVKSRKNGSEMEVDVLGYANTKVNAVVVVEVKSRLTENELKTTLKKMELFFKFFPEHSDKELYGILAVVDLTENMRQRVLAKGLYLAQINDETFRLNVPPDFQPRSFVA